MRKGPNDARHIIWALGECFLISFIFFDDNICFNADMTYNIQTTRLERLWKAKTVRKGPNNKVPKSFTFSHSKHIGSCHQINLKNEFILRFSWEILGTLNSRGFSTMFKMGKLCTGAVYHWTTDLARWDSACSVW